MYQLLTIVGRLGGDPEMRYTPSGTPVTSMNVATNRKYTGSDGQLVKETTWFRVSVFGKQAEACAQYLKKGHMVGLTGKLELEQWEGQDGAKHSRHVGNCERMELMPNKKDDNAPASQPPVTEPAGTDATGDFPDDDIPF